MDSLFIRLALFPLLWGLGIGAFAADKKEPLQAAAPLQSDPGKHVFQFEVPAPRGRILARDGSIFAQSETVASIGIRLLVLMNVTATETDRVSPDELVAKVEEALSALSAEVPEMVQPASAEIIAHWKHRPLIPLTIGREVDWKDLEQKQYPDWLEILTTFSRRYPLGELAAHIMGYASRETPRLTGEYVRGELLWPMSQGRSGLEAHFEKSLSGQGGLLVVVRDDQGRKLEEHVLREPEPGLDVVTTLNVPMQRLASEAFGKTDRCGAVVLLDAKTGDLLALHSEPGFDPNLFVPHIEAATYRALVDDPDAPLHPRAIGGAYPPGSTFKPLVALAALDSGAISAHTMLSGPTSISIDGRRFHNWNVKDEGMMDVRRALMRSTNTWFYQAGLLTGREEILRVAKAFGIGSAPALPIKGVAAGFIADRWMARQGVANISIGQGETLVTPLQVALTMCGFANETYQPKPRLVSQLQNSAGKVVGTYSVQKHLLEFDPANMAVVKEGLYEVVNGGGGTGAKVRLDELTVSGKTGTSQWSAGGIAKNAYWFAGYVQADQPRLALAVLVEGHQGENLYSSQVAAPIAAELLGGIYGEPQRYAVVTPEKIERPPSARRAPSRQATSSR